MLVDEVRAEIAPHKDSAAEWLGLMRRPIGSASRPR